MGDVVAWIRGEDGIMRRASEPDRPRDGPADLVDPQYRHDCPRCVFLGRHEGHDLYWCDQRPEPSAGVKVLTGSPPLPTIMGRFGDADEQYSSGRRWRLGDVTLEAREGGWRAFLDVGVYTTSSPFVPNWMRGEHAVERR